MGELMQQFKILDSTIHLLHRAEQIAEEEFASASISTGLTARQYIVLSVVAQNENLSQTAICEHTGIDRSTLADIVRRLVGRGMLARRRTRQDARMYAVRLTEAGQKAFNEATAAARKVDQCLTSGLSATQKAEFEDAIRQMVVKHQNKRAQVS